MKQSRRHRIGTFLPVVLLIGIALGFFALWRQERMLASWNVAEGVVIHLEAPESTLPEADDDAIAVVFNYTADDRVLQGKVRAGALLAGAAETDALAALRPALAFLRTEEIGAAYPFTEEQPIPLRVFDGVRRLRVPFDDAPRLLLRYHPEHPERYRLDNAASTPALVYPGAFVFTLGIAILMGAILYRRDKVCAAASRAR